MRQGYRKMTPVFWSSQPAQDSGCPRQMSGRAVMGLDEDPQIAQELGRQQATGTNDYRVVADREWFVLVLEYDPVAKEV